MIFVIFKLRSKGSPYNGVDASRLRPSRKTDKRGGYVATSRPCSDIGCQFVFRDAFTLPQRLFRFTEIRSIHDGP